MDLVVGADGFIGGHLVSFLRNHNINVIGTRLSKKSDKGNASDIFLDLRDEKSFETLYDLKHIKNVFICTQAGNIKECERDPVNTREINVTGVEKLLSIIEHLGSVPIYLSSNMVFSEKESAFITEDQEPSPETEYGRQKAYIEAKIQELFPKYIVVRLTKVVGQDNDVTAKDTFSQWKSRLLQGQKIEAFNDSFVQPVFVDDVVQALSFLSNHTGVFHLGGPDRGSYYEFAKKMVRTLGFDQSLVIEKSVTDLDEFERGNKYNYLSYQKAKDLISFNPVSIISLWQK